VRTVIGYPKHDLSFVRLNVSGNQETGVNLTTEEGEGAKGIEENGESLR